MKDSLDLGDDEDGASDDKKRRWMTKEQAKVRIAPDNRLEKFISSLDFSFHI